MSGALASCIYFRGHVATMAPPLMMQVLDTLAYAERELLEAHPEFARARVLVHLSSNIQVSGWLGLTPAASPDMGTSPAQKLLTLTRRDPNTSINSFCVTVVCNMHATRVGGARRACNWGMQSVCHLVPVA